MKVLVSAFKPFNNQYKNLSIEVLKYINNVDRCIVDVIYDDCYYELNSNIDLNKYDLIVALGEARKRKVLTLETKAYNLNNCSLVDNNNVLKTNSIIYKDGKDVLDCNVNLKDVGELVELSSDPGRFVCNNLYYHLLYNHPNKTIFIHIPGCDEKEETFYKLAKDIENIINKLIVLN